MGDYYCRSIPPRFVKRMSVKNLAVLSSHLVNTLDKKRQEETLAACTHLPTNEATILETTLACNGRCGEPAADEYMYYCVLIVRTSPGKCVRTTRRRLHGSTLILIALHARRTRERLRRIF